MIHEAFIKPKRYRMITLERLKYAFRYIFEFKTPCCYLNHPQKVIQVFFGRFRPINAPALGQLPAAFGQTSVAFDFLYRPLSALLGFMAPYRSRESDRGYCPFPYFE